MKRVVETCEKTSSTTDAIPMNWKTNKAFRPGQIKQHPAKQQASNREQISKDLNSTTKEIGRRSWRFLQS
jgi:hypothetical protein